LIGKKPEELLYLEELDEFSYRKQYFNRGDFILITNDEDSDRPHVGIIQRIWKNTRYAYSMRLAVLTESIQWTDGVFRKLVPEAGTDGASYYEKVLQG
jgi:hypothetical protein